MLRLRTGYLVGDIARLWWVFLLVGLFAVSTPFWMDLTVSDTRAYLAGGVAIVVALGLGGSHTGRELDLDSKQFRIYSSIWGYRFGNWQPLPTVSRVIITAKKVSNWNTPNGISPTYRSTVKQYTLGLFTEAPQPVDVLVLDNEKQARNYAQQLTDALGAKLEEV